MIKYDKYKNSGIEWIGEIPEHWAKKKIKYFLKWEKGINAALFTSDYIGSNIGDYPVYSGQTENESILGSINTYDYDFSKKVLLVTTVGAKAMTIRVIQGKFSLSQNCAIIFTKVSNTNIKYHYYFLLRLFEFEKGMISLIMQPSLRFEDLNTFFGYLPPLPEQTAIANFLDRKTAAIDKLIENKKKLIELYEEQKQAIINQAVTKGLDPNAPMKDSGIEWLGKIPEHWELKKLRYIGTCQNGINISGDSFGKGFPFVSYGDVYNNYELPTDIDSLVDSSRKDRENYSVRRGDVFFTRTSETIEEIGIASTSYSDIKDAVFAGFLIRFRPMNEILHYGFSKYYFRTNLLRRFFVKEMNIVTRASLSQELLKKLPVCLPSIEEQNRINDFIEIECNKINQIINKLQKQIKLYKEYRTALISEVVTGKICIV